MWLVLFFFSSGLGSIIHPLFQAEVGKEQQNNFLEVKRKSSDTFALKLGSAFLGVQ